MTTVEQLTIHAIADHLDREPCRCADTDRGTDTLGCEYHDDRVTLPRDLATRALTALRASLTTRGHLAQRVTHEHLGYCGHRSESPQCVAQRALIAQLAVVVAEGDPLADVEPIV